MSEAIIKKTEEIKDQTQPEKAFTFRKLETKDIFPLFKLLNKIGIRDLKENEGMKNVVFAFMGGAATTKGKVDVNKIGMDLFFELASVITENIPKCEMELYTLLASVANLSVDDIKKQSPAVTFEMIVEFVKKEEFKDFFSVALKLFK